MTPINIEVRDATQWFAKQYLDRQDLAPERRRNIERLTEYNILAYGFNASTVVLAVAAVAAAFFSFTTAAVLGATALFARLTASHEMENLAKPGGVDALAHAVNQTAPTPQERIQNICQKVGIQAPPAQDWTETFVSVFGHAVWKRTIPQDAQLLHLEQEEEVDQVPQGRLHGIAQMFMQHRAPQQQEPLELQQQRQQQQQDMMFEIPVQQQQPPPLQLGEQALLDVEQEQQEQ